MITKLPQFLTPLASFVVERLPCEGYQVTSADGPRAAEWSERALDLLDTLGQPDPNGPVEYIRLVGPLSPAGECVSVWIRLLPNGEARYRQTWFQVPTQTRSFWHRVASCLVLLLVGAAMGAVGGIAGVWKFSICNRWLLRPAASESAPLSPERGKSDVPAPARDAELDELHNDLILIRPLLVKLHEFLSQEGFPAMDQEVTDVKTVVRLSDSFTRSDGPPATIKQRDLPLTNVDVRDLLKLFERLKKLSQKQAVDEIPARKPSA